MHCNLLNEEQTFIRSFKMVKMFCAVHEVTEVIR